MPGEYRLRSCVWELTLACCFSCKYCGSRAGKARENELTTAECLSVVEQLAELGCERVSLIGGEIFLRKDWKVIATAMTNAGIRVDLITNGFIFTQKLIEDIRETGVNSVAVSIDGTREIHDKYRQEGSYDRAMEAVKVLSANGIPTSVISTLNSESVKELPALYEELKKHAIYAWQLQACSPMGNAAIGGLDYHFDVQKVIDYISQNRESASFLMGIADNIGYFTPEDGYLRGDPSGRSYFGGCSAGIRSIGIDSVGNVRGCESMYDERFNEGNLREKTLKAIWENPNGFAYNRKFTPKLLTGKCSVCEMGPYCAAGCRSYNYFVHGKLYEAPVCAREMQTEE